MWGYVNALEMWGKFKKLGHVADLEMWCMVKHQIMWVMLMLYICEKMNFYARNSEIS